jgi:type IV pilus assembly protein PilX
MISYNKQQSGIVLVIGLIMLLLLTLIGLTAMKVTSTEEKITGNFRNHNIAFQAAESALREAEALIDSGGGSFNPFRLSNGPFQNTTSPICVAGICGVSSPLQSANLAATVGKQTATTGIAGIVAEPEYIIELIRTEESTDLSRYYATFRITVRAWGGTLNSPVQLESTYKLHALTFVN